MQPISLSPSRSRELFAASPCGEKTNEPFFFRNIKLIEASVLSKNQQERPFWYYLTLGIPILIETLSVFFEGISHREIADNTLLCRFRYKFMPQSLITKMDKFHRYNEPISAVLNKGELDQALRMGYQCIKKMEIAQYNNNETNRIHESKKLESIISLLEKHKSKASRKEITEQNWKVIDLVDFEIAKDHFIGLTNLFNEKWFQELGLNAGMKYHFDVDYHQAVVAEGLSMALAYIEGLNNQSIQLPFLDEKTGVYRSVKYRIKELILGDALPCYVLESEDQAAPPWFVIRGTQMYKDRVASLESILTDILDNKGIADKIINKALARSLVKDVRDSDKELLNDVFTRWQKDNKSYIVTGHSLGGTLANTLAVEFPNKLKACYAFSAMGVARKTQAQYQKLQKELQEKIINFDFEGDVVPSGGHFLIGRHFAIAEAHKEKIPVNFYEIHSQSHICRDFTISKIDVDKENNKFARTIAEKIRVIAGTCLGLLFHFFGYKYLPDWWLHRKFYKKYANKQREINATFKAAPPAPTNCPSF